MKNPTSISPADLNPGASIDALLGGRLRLLQPANGFRAAIDPLLLAAGVPARAGEHVLEVGSGSGAAALCLATRVAAVRVTGLDMQVDLVALANESAALNRMSDRVAFVAGDLLSPPSALEAAFDHVMANPPYLRAGTGRVSPDPAKALASVEGAADLAAWVAFCAGRTTANGTVTFVHRADRASEVAAEFAAAGLETIVFPLGPARVLVQGIKNGRAGVSHAPGLVLHDAAGHFSAAADAILRGGASLNLRDR